MKKEFYEPPGGLTVEVLEDALGMVMEAPPGREYIEAWCELERIVAYDYAARLHLSASDNKLKPRPMPWFVSMSATLTAEENAEEEPVEAGEAGDDDSEGGAAW